MKLAEEYRKDARRIRALAETMVTPDIRATLLTMAATYDDMARQAELIHSALVVRQTPPETNDS